MSNDERDGGDRLRYSTVLREDVGMRLSRIGFFVVVVVDGVIMRKAATVAKERAGSRWDNQDGESWHDTQRQDVRTVIRWVSLGRAVEMGVRRRPARQKSESP